MFYQKKSTMVRTNGLADASRKIFPQKKSDKTELAIQSTAAAAQQGRVFFRLLPILRYPGALCNHVENMAFYFSPDLEPTKPWLSSLPTPD